MYILVQNKISQAMKKYYYECPRVPPLNFEEGPGVPLLNLKEVPGPTFKI